jgi:predicted CoA-binding protein
METTTLDTKVHEFLAQKRIAVAGVSRNDGGHPAANLIYRRLKTTGHDVFPVNPHIRPSMAIAAFPTCSRFPAASTGW